MIGAHAMLGAPMLSSRHIAHDLGVYECVLVHKYMFLHPFGCLLPYKMSWDLGTEFLPL